MLKYNDDDIYVGQIKQLLKAFNLPTCRVHKEGNIYYDGEFFIDKEIGYLCQFKNGQVIKKQRYHFNDEILNITKHLEIRNNYYDTYTHEYLGEFLRFIKDYLDIDLMSMYNCFSNNIPRNFEFEFTKDNVTYEITTKEPGRTLYMVPVKPNTTYTIAIEYPFRFEIFCSFCAFNSHIFTEQNFEVKSMKQVGGSRFNHPFTYTTPNFSDVSDVRDVQQKNLHNYKMFLELPSSFSNNIVILEGDYTKSTELLLYTFTQKLGYNFFEFAKEDLSIKDGKWYFNDIDTEISSTTFPQNGTTITINWDNEFKKYTITFEYNDNSTVWETTKRTLIHNDDFYLSRHQLLDFSTTTKYLVADRLLEYLSFNVINPYDKVINDIKKIQICLAGAEKTKVVEVDGEIEKIPVYSFDSTFTFDKYGIWSESIRKWIYKFISTVGDNGSNLTYRDEFKDTLCFVDKDIESVLKTLKMTGDDENKKSPATTLIEELGGL